MTYAFWFLAGIGASLWVYAFAKAWNAITHTPIYDTHGMVLEGWAVIAATRKGNR